MTSAVSILGNFSQTQHQAQNRFIELFHENEDWTEQ